MKTPFCRYTVAIRLKHKKRHNSTYEMWTGCGDTFTAVFLFDDV